MEEVVVEAGRPLFRLFYYIFRGVLWLAWDLSIQMIGWSVGWFVLRLLTFGHLPNYKFSEQNIASFGQALFIELFGVFIIGLITFLSYGLAFQ